MHSTVSGPHRIRGWAVPPLLAGADLRLTDDERARLDEVRRPTLLYAYWHQTKTACDRLFPAEPIGHRDAGRAPLEAPVLHPACASALAFDGIELFEMAKAP
jgi:hypothetical protein